MTEMIYVYEKMPGDLETNGHALTDWEDLPEISRSLNGKFSFYGNYSLEGQNREYLKKGHFLKALTENGTWQYFEIYGAKGNLNAVAVNGRFIGAMANKNFIEYSKTDNGSVSQIMSNLQNSLAFPQKFRYSSNVGTVHQFTAKQVGPIDAIIGSNNGNQNLVGVTGAEFDADNYDLKLVKMIGADQGYRIDFGVNLEAIEVSIDEEAVVNSLYLVGGVPDNDYDAEKEPITYKYLEVKGVTDENRRIGKRENSNCKTIEELKKWGQSLFDNDRIHEAKATHKVNMVALEHTLEYGEIYQELSKLHFGDVTYVPIPQLGIDIRERMAEYVWFPTIGKFKSIVLGNNLSKYTSRVQTETEKLADRINNRTETLVQNVLNATAWITGNKGGYVIFRPEKAPEEILIMDNREVDKAKRVWRWNLNGLGYSDNGVNGPFGIAMTSKGEIVADFIKVGVIQADVFESSFNATGDVMKLVKGTLQAWNGTKKIMELTKRGMEFWSGDLGIGTMGTAGEPFPLLSDNNGPIKMDGKAIITMLTDGDFIAMASQPGHGIVMRKSSKQMFIIDDKIAVIGEMQINGDLNVMGSLKIKGQEVYPGGNGGSGGGNASDIFVRVLELTAKYEMGDRNSGYYHPPLNDGAGWNYGKYSFTEVYEMTPFLSWLGQYYPDIRGQLHGSVGSDQFNSSWAAYGAANDAKFTQVQAEYFCRQKLKPKIEYLKANAGVDLNDGNKWLGTLGLLASITNWYPASVNAGGWFYRFVVQYAGSWNDAAFITSVCDYIVANAAGMVAPEYVQGIQNRFRAEKVDALARTEKVQLPWDGAGSNKGLSHIKSLLGQSVGNGECYALSAEYSGFLGGCGLGAGTRYPISHVLPGGNTSAASDIGDAYNWSAVGWTVIKNPSYSQLRVGAIINWKRGSDMGGWYTDLQYGHTGVIRGLSGGKIQTYEQNTEKGRVFAELERNYMSAAGIQSIVIPPR